MSTVLVTGRPAANHSVGQAHPTDKPIRVMVVDDAVVVRSLLARWIDAEPDMHVVASLPTGREAVAWFEKNDADVVMLDIEMPELDGISALPAAKEARPRGHHGLDLHAAQRRDQLARAGTGRCRLYPEA
jgi:DNA-binding NarL/FixJ family response regulator